MTLTLGEAVAEVARVAGSGMCATDPRVKDRVNEAVARLHAQGDWVGSVARYGVTVRPDGTFVRPAALANIMRVSELTPGIVHSPGGELICDDENAFLFDAQSVLPLMPVAPNVFRIVGGPVPEAVDIMGKRALTTATHDNDILAVNDVQAIKLMVLALHREENNRPDLAAPLRDEAITHLTTKTQTAVGEARRVIYTNMLSGCAENTFGHYRAQFALTANNGLRLDDHKIHEVVNAAEQRIMQQTRQWEPRLFNVCSGELALPAEYESILALDFNNVPKTIRSQWHEYSPDGMGYREQGFNGSSAIYRGESPLHTKLPGPTMLTVSTGENERSAKVRITGRDTDGNSISDELTLTGAGSWATTNTYAAVDSITKDPTIGAVSVTVTGDTKEVALLQSWQTESRCAIYAIPSRNDCAISVVRAILRPRWYRKLRDTDLMQVRNLPAVINMGIAVLAEREGRVDEANAYEARALRYFNEERIGRESAHQRRPQLQVAGWGAGSIRQMM